MQCSFPLQSHKKLYWAFAIRILFCFARPYANKNKTTTYPRQEQTLTRAKERRRTSGSLVAERSCYLGQTSVFKSFLKRCRRNDVGTAGRSTWARDVFPIPLRGVIPTHTSLDANCTCHVGKVQSIFISVIPLFRILRACDSEFLFARSPSLKGRMSVWKYPITVLLLTSMRYLCK